MSIQDETMSQDAAFTTENDNANTFEFDEVEETSPDSQTKEEENTDTDSASHEDKQEDVSDQKVPYSRFKKVIEERDSIASRIAELEASLEEIRNSRVESDTTEVELPTEWIELYGDSDVAKKAYKIQLKREEQIFEMAADEAVSRLRKQQEEEVGAIAENEEVIDNQLEDLSERIGKKLSDKDEEAILSIVDEFSPVGEDGKYITLFPFEKAYEIYRLRSEVKGIGTRNSRNAIADLSSDTSDGEADQTEGTFKRGWDNWREALN